MPIQILSDPGQSQLNIVCFQHVPSRIGAIPWWSMNPILPKISDKAEAADESRTGLTLVIPKPAASTQTGALPKAGFIFSFFPGWTICEPVGRVL
ncbi:MAG TPA: hypothetical protein PLL36_00830 [Candidatus Hydrogenedentes bacterium]|nr:MAG: hypothetical protein BWX80_02977 [Candidatus Hydrogenedentes bacterium ADurb.Bin101]HOC70297.1 hypothetical protein [Candidatus Hydrogenedentota bacterium]HOH31947.1 hypothetical protein [Candidatus Hydrogenedentota bacterium]HQM99584.1 hypothetical protein [Candidatus Hydrogenedentota bacterium]